MNSFMQDPGVAENLVRQITAERIRHAEARRMAREMRRQHRDVRRSAPREGG
jgi:hypothetical protein